MLDLFVDSEANIQLGGGGVGKILRYGSFGYIFGG